MFSVIVARTDFFFLSNHLVEPAQVDEDGFILYESRAIARYLIAKYAPDNGLIPRDLKKNALFEQAMSIESSNFAPNALSLGSEVMKP